MVSTVSFMNQQRLSSAMVASDHHAGASASDIAMKVLDQRDDASSSVLTSNTQHAAIPPYSNSKKIDTNTLRSGGNRLS